VNEYTYCEYSENRIAWLDQQHTVTCMCDNETDSEGSDVK